MTLPGAPRTSPGWLLTLEGPDGAGKTSQAHALRDAAIRARVEVVMTREPGGTSAGERIRDLLLNPTVGRLAPTTDALLFNAARAELVSEVIEPTLERGALVICTRFADSTIAYQGYGAGVPLDDLRAMERVATGGLKPDLTILLDLPVELGLSRKSGHEVTRFETEFDLAFHRRVRDGFLALAAEEPNRFVVIDASRPAAVVEREVLAVAGRLPGLPALVPESTPREPREAAERIHG